MVNGFTITIMGIQYPHNMPVLELIGQPIPIKSIETDGSNFDKEDKQMKFEELQVERKNKVFTMLIGPFNNLEHCLKLLNKEADDWVKNQKKNQFIKDNPHLKNACDENKMAWK